MGYHSYWHTLHDKQNLTAARADTVRKMQEKLKDHLHRDRYSARLIDQIAEEMLEEET